MTVKVLSMNKFLNEYALWTIVALGILPAALAAVIPPGIACVDWSLNSQFFCEVGMRRAESLVNNNTRWIYIALFLIGGIIVLLSKRFFRLLSLAPLLILVIIPATEIPELLEAASIDYVTTEDQISADLLIVRTDAAVTLVKARNFFADSDISEVDSAGKSLLTTTEGLSSISAAAVRKEAELKSLSDQFSKLPTRTIRRMEDTTPPTFFLDKVTINQAAARSISAAIETKKQELVGHRVALAAAIAAQKNAIRDFNAALDALTTGSSVNSNAIAWQVLGIASLIALIGLLYTTAIRSIAYGQLFLAVTTLSIFTSSGTFEFSVDSVLMPLYPIFLFTAISVIVRLAILAFIQNKDVKFEKAETWPLLFKTLSRWWVIAVLAFLGFWASSQIDSFAERMVYCIGQETERCDPSAGNVVRDWPEKPDIQGDIDLSIDKHFVAAEQKIEAGLSQAMAGTDGSGEAVRTAVLNMVFDSQDAILPTHLYSTYVPELKPPPSCKWFFPDIGCFAERYIKKAINAAYENARARQRVRLSKRLQELGSQGEVAATSQIETISNELHRSLKEARLSIKVAVSNVFLTISILNLIANFLLCVALIKSFIFILARFYFENRPDRNLTMESGQVPDTLPPQIKDTFASNYTFSASSADHYVNRKYDVSGVPGNISIPIPLQGLGRRILSRTWIVNHVEFSRFPNASIQTGQAAQFVEWELREGEKIYIDADNLVSFSGGINIKTEVSLRVTSIMFGRLFFFTLSGPGVVVLRTIGEPKICPTTEDGASFAPSRFVAWAANSRLGVVAKTNLANIYLSGSQIALSDESDGAVIDAKREDASMMGALKFIPACILPF